MFRSAISEVVEQIGMDAAKAATEVRDSSTGAATEASPWGADFLKASKLGLKEIGWQMTDLSTQTSFRWHVVL